MKRVRDGLTFKCFLTKAGLNLLPIDSLDNGWRRAVESHSKTNGKN